MIEPTQVISATPATGSRTAAPDTPPATGAPDVDSPVAAWRAAAVGRAIGSLGGAATTETASATAASAAAAPQASLESMALTPLEQAVHELIGRIGERDPARPRAAKPATASAPTLSDLEAAPLHTLASPHAIAAMGRDLAASEPARAGAPIPPPEPPANPSHIHLVLDDGPDRVVVTVAVRGSDIHVALRASDDATAAALARNAGSLDHAMRARGLALGELTTEREPHDQAPPQDAEPRERRNPDAEPFELEETP